MNRLLAVLAAGALMATSTVCDAKDTVKVLGGGQVLGRIMRTSPTEVEVETTAGLSKKIPVNEIVAIYFDEEPTQMLTGRKKLEQGDFEGALETFKAANPRVKKEAITQDIEFYRAYCKAQLALAGSEDVATAGREMMAFVNANKNNYHWLQANQTVGDLLVAMGKSQAAAEYYAKVAAAPWPDYKMRAGVALGRALLSQGKVAEAAKHFDEVLAQKDDSDLAKVQRTAATIGKIRCEATDKSKAEDTIKAVNALLDNTDSDQADIMAQCYNALGTAYRALGRNTEAICAFLHVELLYASQPDAYAEALGNLMALWKAQNKPDREQQTRQTLQERYPNSIWLKKGG